MRRSRAAQAPAFGLALALAACGDPIEDAWRLDRPRILGARTEVVSDQARTAPSPGEEARVELVTASRGAPRGAFGDVAAVRCLDGSSGADFSCRGAPLGLSLERADGLDPVFRFGSETDVARVIIYGIACTAGRARVAIGEGGALGAACEGGAGQEFSIRLEPSDNRQPVGEPEVVFDGARLDPDAGCESAQRKLVSADAAEHQLRVTIPEAARELDDTPVLSTLATHGELDGLYAADPVDGVFAAAWRAPRTLGSAEETARIHLVLRDGRGGTTAFFRSVCLQRR